MNIRCLISILLLIASNCFDANSLNAQQMKVIIGNKTYTATMANNSTADAFRAMLPMSIRMDDLNSNEKYHYLPQSLPVNAYNPTTINSGDIMLFGASCLVLFYQTFKTQYSYTPIGHIDNVEGLESALGSGSVSITFAPASSTGSVGEVETSSPFRIYPIPVRNKLTIEGLFASVCLTDLNGTIVAQSNYSPFDLSHVKSGVYLLQIRDRDNRLYIHKLTKQ